MVFIIKIREKNIKKLMGQNTAICEKGQSGHVRRNPEGLLQN